MRKAIVLGFVVFFAAAAAWAGDLPGPVWSSELVVSPVSLPGQLKAQAAARWHFRGDAFAGTGELLSKIKDASYWYSGVDVAALHGSAIGWRWGPSLHAAYWNGSEDQIPLQFELEGNKLLFGVEAQKRQKGSEAILKARFGNKRNGVARNAVVDRLEANLFAFEFYRITWHSRTWFATLEGGAFVDYDFTGQKQTEMSLLAKTELWRQGNVAIVPGLKTRYTEFDDKNAIEPQFGVKWRWLEIFLRASYKPGDMNDERSINVNVDLDWLLQ
jgi:hypothetical protein